MWVVYLVRCADATLYCGITNDLEARIAAHSVGKGAKYTRRRGPVTLVFSQRCRTKHLALRIEYAIKQLTRPEKDALVAEPTRIAPIVVRARRQLRAAA
ncbi:MAG TPA: GIY-YIG nuclease family protein [Kofleriaceae bacterium]|nr:GIY-YIG nuclease family protein [Kofleriaceae bacterium]